MVASSTTTRRVIFRHGLESRPVARQSAALAATLASLALLAPGPATDLETPETLVPVTLSGSRMRFNGCLAFDVHEGLSAPAEVVLRWSRPASRRDWLQGLFDRELGRFGDDLWNAWRETGGGLQAAATGMVLEATATTDTEDCEGDPLPVYDVRRVVAGYDTWDRRRLPRAIEPLSRGFDASSPTTEALLASASGARNATTIHVDGITDPSLGWPPWQLEGVVGASDEPGEHGFVDLQFSPPDLAPDAQATLRDMLLELGVTELDDLRGSRRTDVRREAIRRSLGSHYRYRGHLTGEVTLFRDVEAIYLTPVFIVTGLAQ
jgi:hypothetical protein